MPFWNETKIRSNNKKIYFQAQVKISSMGLKSLYVRVFPIKPRMLKKISGMFIVWRPIRCEMKPQNITDKPQQGSVTTWYETTSRPFFFYKESSTFPLDLSEKAIFWPQTNTSHLIPSVQKPNYRIDPKVSTNCENLQWYRSTS